MQRAPFGPGSGQSSSGCNGILNSSPGSGCPWPNQSCVSNWIQAAASRLRLVAGMKLRRASSSRETTRGIGYTLRQWDIAAKAGAAHPHTRMVQTVEGAVGGTPALLARAPIARFCNAVAGVMQIIRAQPVAENAEICGREQCRQAIPGDEEIADPVHGAEKAFQQPRAKLEAVVLTRHAGLQAKVCAVVYFAGRFDWRRW